MINRLSLLCAIAFSAMVGVAFAGPLTAGAQEYFEPMSAGIGRAIRVTLYEGLPHQTFEADILLREIEHKKSIVLHGYPFYERPLRLLVRDVAELRRIFSDKTTYEIFHGEKLCGGFHPDYGMTWEQGGQTYTVLICFGCREFKLFGPDHDLRTNANPEVFARVEAILKRYHGQRPKPKDR
jgi:hypothetical protein